MRTKIIVTLFAFLTLATPAHALWGCGNLTGEGTLTTMAEYRLCHEVYISHAALAEASDAINDGNERYENVHDAYLRMKALAAQMSRRADKLQKALAKAKKKN